MAALDSLISNLTAEDLSIRLYAILTLHDRRHEPGLAAQLKAATDRETDPSLRLYLTWLADSEKTANEYASQTVISLLDQPEIDWMGLFYTLHRIDQKTAREILPRIRLLDTDRLPEGLLPMLVRFYHRFGSQDDNQRLIKWCSHPNPVVMSLAVEALSRIQPDCLKTLLLPLLSNQSPGIRSRAIRLLHRWYPDEAPRHLAEMLDSELTDDRRAALANAFFLPFDSIKLEILRFIIREESPVLLLQAGNILIINPDPEVARVTASIAVNTSPEKAPVIRQILEQQIEFLIKAGLVKTTAAEEIARLLNEALQRRQSRQQPLNDPDEQARKIRQMVVEKQQEALPWLKQSFKTTLPEPVLLAVTENLALLDPEFLRPYLSELLRSTNLGVQVAALTALTRISPAQAEKLLEQYIFSSVIQRRKTGFHVLSLMERAFALPLMLKAMAREHDSELLEYFSENLPQPLDATCLGNLARESMLAPETHKTRLPFLEKLYSSHNLNLNALTDSSAIGNDFALENVMISRAAVEAMALPAAPAPQPAQQQTSDLPDQAAEQAQQHIAFSGQFAQKSVLERLLAAQRADETGDFSNALIELLLKNEKNEFVRFQLEMMLRKRELAHAAIFSPVSLLQKNFVKTNPDWLDVAAGLASLQNRPARLAAPLLQHRQWQAWRHDALPVVLAFIGRTGQTMFSPQVAALIKHQHPEVRFSAIKCLEQINPEELGAALPEILTDRSAEIVALAGQLQKSINERLSSTISATTPVRKFLAAGRGRSPLWMLPIKSPRLTIAAVILVLALLLCYSQPEAEKPGFLPPTAGRPVPKELTRFASLKKPAEKDEERVIFGRIETVKVDSMVVHSPVLQRRILVRCSKPPTKKENDHFSGRVKISDTGSSMIEAVLLDDNRSK